MERLDIYMRLQTLEVLVHTLLFVYLETISVLHMSDLQFHLNPTSIKIGKWTRYSLSRPINQRIALLACNIFIEISLVLNLSKDHSRFINIENLDIN